MKKKIVVFLSMFLLFVFVVASAERLIADDDESTSAGVTKFGVTHNVAPDREIVNIGGRYEPEGLDFYLKKKFDSMEAKVGQLMEKIDELEKKITYTNERIEMLINKSTDKKS